MSRASILPPVLILGCGRSGTSIFGELFDGLAGYRYRSEPDFAEMLAGFGPSRAAKVPRESIGYPPDPGLSFPLDALLAEHPTTRILWIVRHPFDAVSSLRVGIRQDWGHHPRPPDWRSWLDRPLIERCAHHWAFINEHGFRTVREMAVVVRFEDMLRSPREFAEDVCDRIGISPADRRDGVDTWADRVQDTNNERFVEAQTSRSYSRRDHQVRVGRWRENLDRSEVRTVAAIVARANAAFGYSLSDTRTSPREERR